MVGSGHFGRLGRVTRNTQLFFRPNCRLWLNIIDYFLCRFHEELISAGILTPLRSEIEGNRSRDPSVSHHVAPQGVSSIVKHFLNQSGTGVIYYPQKTFTI